MILLSLIVFAGIGRLSAQESPSQDNPVSFLDGIWTGSAYQYNMNDSWDMTLTCNTEEDKFIIEYPSLSCGGHLILMDGTKKDKVVLRGKITYGSCLDNLIIELTVIDNDNLDYICHYENSTHIIAKGKLSRQEP